MPCFLRMLSTRAIAVICLTAFFQLGMQAQAPVTVDSSFSSAWLVPATLRDASYTFSANSVFSGVYDTAFRPAQKPFLTFGTDLSRYWLKFKVQNNLPHPKTLVLRLNRKNIAYFQLWAKNPDSTLHDLGAVGASVHGDARFALSDGYHYAVTLPPGESEFLAASSNHIGAMYLALQLHSPDSFGLLTRQNMVLFGIFLGVLAVSFVFSLILFAQYRDVTYLLYGVYLLNILAREAYNYSADFGLLSHIGHQCVSYLIAATYGLFLRKFLQLWEMSPRMDKLVQAYVGGVVVSVALVWLLDGTGHLDILQHIFTVVNVFFILFTLNALYLSFRHFRRSPRARLALWAFLPLSMSFIAILLRNLAIIPAWPFIQHAVVLGFILEALVFTIGFSRWHRTVESDRKLLQLKLAVEQQEKQLAVQAAEQRVKDRIARDLHDDVAASMSGIRILSQVAHSQFSQKAPDAAPLLLQISQNAQSTLESISDLIWAVKPHADYLNDMADRMREYAVKMLDAKDIDYEMNIPRNLPMRDLDIETRRSIYLIFKEALNNAMKYSECSRINISLQVENERLNLRVADNGGGFDSAVARRGNGLMNMEKRARDIGGDFYITTAPGQGTDVRFSLPL